MKMHFQGGEGFGFKGGEMVRKGELVLKGGGNWFQRGRGRRKKEEELCTRRRNTQGKVERNV